jgi:hypothetical protein
MNEPNPQTPATQSNSEKLGILERLWNTVRPSLAGKKLESPQPLGEALAQPLALALFECGHDIGNIKAVSGRLIPVRFVKDERGDVALIVLLRKKETP